MSVQVNINEQKIIEKVTNDKFGLYVSKTWKDLIDPYTPRDKGFLMGEKGQTVDVQPFKLWYKQRYATYQYDGISSSGKPLNYQKINPYSTDHWDLKAAEAGQLNKLYTSLNDYLRKK